MATGQQAEARQLAETDPVPVLHDWAELGALVRRLQPRLPTARVPSR